MMYIIHQCQKIVELYREIHLYDDEADEEGGRAEPHRLGGG